MRAVVKRAVVDRCAAVRIGGLRQWRAQVAVLVAVVALLASVVITSQPPAEATSGTGGLASVPGPVVGVMSEYHDIAVDPLTGMLHLSNTITEKIDVRRALEMPNAYTSFGATTLGGVTLDYPIDIEFMDDSIYVAYWASGHVVQYNRSTYLVENWTSDVSNPTGLFAVDGEVWVADRSAKELVVFTADLSSRIRTIATVHQLIPDFPGANCAQQPNDVVVTDTDIFFITIGLSCATEGVWRYDRANPPTGVDPYLSPPYPASPVLSNSSLYAMDLSPAGELFVTGNGGVIVVDAANPGTIVESVTLGALTGVTVDESGDTVWGMYRGNSNGSRITPATRERCNDRVPTMVGTSAADTFGSGPVVIHANDWAVLWTGDGDDHGDYLFVPYVLMAACLGAGDDYLRVGAGRSFVWGESGDDEILGSGYNDTLDGGLGDDRLVGHGGEDLIRGGPGNDLLYGGAQDDRIYGGSGADEAYGDGGDDLMYGAAGHDTLEGGDGADVLHGQANNDSLRGGDGDDELIGSTGFDELRGDGGDDQLNGGLGDDYIVGGTGDDDITAGGGNDSVFGGYGNDVIRGFGGNDVLSGDEGADTISGGGGVDLIWGGVRPGIFGGADLADVITGGPGDDTMHGSTGTDTMAGNGGNDTMYGGGSGDTMNGGGGSDDMFGDGGDDIMIGSIGNDVLWGLGGDDTLNGAAGNDELQGGAGIDALDGGANYDECGPEQSGSVIRCEVIN